MYKPIYVKPFIIVYHIVAFLFSSFIALITYSLKGLSLSTKFLFEIGLFLGKKLIWLLWMIGKFLVEAFVWIVNCIYHFVQYSASGIIITVSFLYRWISFFVKKVIEGIVLTATFLYRVGKTVVLWMIKVITFIIQCIIRLVLYLTHLITTGVMLTYQAISYAATYSGNKFWKGCLVSANFISSVARTLYTLTSHGFLFCCKHLAHFFYMVWFGIDVFAYYTMRGFTVTYEFIVHKIEQYKAYRKRKREEAHKRRVAEHVKKEQIREEKLRKKAEERERRTDTYINKDVVLNKKPTLGERINKFLLAITHIPTTIRNSFNKTTLNKMLVKKNKKKRAFDKEVLDLDLEEEEKKKKKDKQSRILYEYVAKDKTGKTVKGYFEAFNKMEVKSFLINEGLEVYSIRTNRWITLFHRDTASGKVKMKTKDLVFFLTQLSTYIKAGITLAESLEILSRQFKNKHYQRIIKSLVYDLNLGVSFSEALEKQGDAFPRLLINMIRASELSGSLPEVLDDQAEYFDQMEQTRKQMITAMMYPSIVFVIAIGVLTFVMLFVVPQFVDIFESMDGAQIPGITIFIMNMSEFMKNYILYIFLAFIVLCLIFRYLYKNVTLIRRWTQNFIMHLPVFGNVIIYNEVTTFTKTFSSLMGHNVFITDTMNILKKITNNEIYKDLINKTIENLSTGERISAAFKDHWAFPVPAYEMLVTGERTGELPEMMGKVSLYYQDLHRNAVARIKVFIEPILIITLTAMVGLIVLAIVVPMFQMYSAIQSM